MRNALLVTAVAALALFGCDAADPVVASTSAPAPVVPLEVGGEWTFALSYTVAFDDAGAARDTTRRDGGRAETLAVTRDTVVAGERWVQVVASRGLQHCVFGGAGWFANRADGLYRWDEGPESAELVYARGVEPGVPFVETPVVVAVLDDADATYALPSGPVEGARYVRTWRRIEIDDALPEPVRGPIRPTMTSADVLSPDLGPVLLELAYARHSRQVEGSFTPSGTVAYELVSYSSGAPPPASAAPPAAGVVDGFAAGGR